jgi:hypothetical protein
MKLTRHQELHLIHSTEPAPPPSSFLCHHSPPASRGKRWRTGATPSSSSCSTLSPKPEHIFTDELECAMARAPLRPLSLPPSASGRQLCAGPSGTAGLGHCWATKRAVARSCMGRHRSCAALNVAQFY